MKYRRLILLTAVVLVSAIALTVSGMVSNTTIQALSPSELSSLGGSDCYVGRCEDDRLRSDCDSSIEDQYCVDYTNEYDCCIVYTGRSDVYECTGLGSGSYCCWSSGETFCLVWDTCKWVGDECREDEYCGPEYYDDEDCSNHS